MWHPQQALSHLYSHSLVASGSVSGPQLWEVMSPAERELLKCCKVSVCHSSCDLCPLLSSTAILYFALFGSCMALGRTGPWLPLHLLCWIYDVIQHEGLVYSRRWTVDFFNALSTWNSWKTMLSVFHIKVSQGDVCAKKTVFKFICPWGKVLLYCP